MNKLYLKILMTLTIFSTISCVSPSFNPNYEQDVVLQLQASKGYIINALTLYTENKQLLLEGNVKSINVDNDEVQGHVDITVTTPDNIISTNIVNLKYDLIKKPSVKPSSFLIKNQGSKASSFNYSFFNTLPKGSIIYIKYDADAHKYEKSKNINGL